MTRYISLLRGINVGGHKKIVMTDLKLLYETLGFTAIQTYIQSGNLIFAAETRSTAMLAQQIEQAIAQQYGFEVIVIVLTAEELQSAAQSNPFQLEGITESDQLLLVFLSQIPLPDHVANIDHNAYLPDRFALVGSQIYLYCPNGYGQTKLSNDFFERKLRLKATTRNSNTIAKLCSMIASASIR